ncbi:hypothetical protein DSM25558_5201 [Agrobacterium sp. DSM 25558]|uniref:hypothetical protein n=1 Tax=Agrobacterium sp. DSM 25558 TaxID=1907665 RepID=UPI00097253FB|nr:hypothetical protein [Agrobacterium sp. DSM 25558]SCX31388.1 hypothetical protein DSM25558_5201 [Agrobacterium sp. DSM 25558]
MFSNELEKMLILHIADLDEGVRRMKLLQLRLAGVIDEIFEGWAAENGWLSEHSWHEDGACTLLPPEWQDGDGSSLGFFALEYGAGDDEIGIEHDHFWITRLCAEGRGSVGLRFFQNKFGKTTWKKLLVNETSMFAGTRFIIDDEPSIYLPIQIDKEVLANAAEEESFETALTPVFSNAFNHMLGLRNRFDELLSDISQ